MSQWRAVVLAVSLVSLSACHMFRFEVSKEPHEVLPVVDRKTFWVFAWFPTLEVDVRKICPAGVALIEEETTVTDGLLTLLTLDIYAPRTSYYYCRIPQPPAALPAPAPGGATP
jgi:Bor protein